MDESDFLAEIYKSINVGDIILKPRANSEILSISNSGNIRYRIGSVNHKDVTKNELRTVFQILSKGSLHSSKFNEIIPAAKPCNATTIKWLITHAGLAQHNTDGTYTRLW